MEKAKKNILILMGRYLPGYKDGGPVRSIQNLTDRLGNEYNFMILTCDRDHGDTKAYPGIRVNDWNRMGNAKVFYVPPNGFRYHLIRSLATSADMVYVCGCFNDYAIHTLILKRLGLIKKPVVIAAMGLFSPMEFRLKYLKKKTFVTAFKFLGMFRNIYWSVTSEMELNEIRQQIKIKSNYFIAEDLPRNVDNSLIKKNKEKNMLRVVWISRIAPKKNLLGAIKILQNVKSRVNFTIYGPVHNEEYWNSCKDALKRLPDNICWSYGGNVTSERVIDTLKNHHVFLFPTLGENYGHVILEALSAGCPALLSDQTPWKDLESNGIGYAFGVEDLKHFISAIENFAKMDQKSYQQVADKALWYAVNYSNNKVLTAGYRSIFDTL